MYERISKPSKSQSFFLFGARATGKSTLLNGFFNEKEAILINLLNPDLEDELVKNPQHLIQLLDPVRNKKEITWVIIDEIQKAPRLLDIIHLEIEKKRFKFALTGSSARKIKRGAANLLAGRALQNYLYPLTTFELAKDFNLDFVLKWGSLPEVFNIAAENRADYLRSYTQTYLKEEIQVEQLVRKLAPFRSFLEVAAQSSGKILNYSKIARDINSDSVSVKNYFQILEDTLIGFYLPAYHNSIRKRQSQHPKFYLFDLGVKTALQKHLNLDLEKSTYRYGDHFEHWIISEIVRYNHYLKLDWTLTYLKTKDNLEVDLIIERPGMSHLFIEIKSKKKITLDDVRHLHTITKDLKNTKAICLSQDKTEKKIKNVNCHFWKDGLKEIGIKLNF